ncbi:MAG: OsmC family protein [Proteobacteria bacterium]|nr:OsmC family protein [Pseudomonadota bacterium]
MQGFPHRYPVSASAKKDGLVLLDSPGAAQLASAPPIEFDGPGDQWSPESLLTASVADCVILTFRAIARASKLEWNEIEMQVDGTLDRVDRVTRFTHFDIQARLRIPAGTDADKAKLLLEKAEKNCLVSNSLNAEKSMAVSVEIG